MEFNEQLDKKRENEGGYIPVVNTQIEDVNNNRVENEDFVGDMKEYWHFDYGNASWALEKEKKHSIYGIIKT